MKNYEATLSQIFYVVLPMVRRAGQMLSVKQPSLVGKTGANLESAVKDIVTEVSNFLSETVQMLFPEHAVFGVESEKKADWQWIFAPLDGTLYYKNGLPLFTTAAVLRHKGEVVLAIVHQPQTEDTYHAMVKDGAFHNGLKINVSNTTDVRGALAYVDARDGSGENKLRSGALTSFTEAGAAVLALGVPSLGLCYLAAGLYDVCYLAIDSKGLINQVAGLTIAREAGAVVTDGVGRSLAGQPIESVLVANKVVHPKAVALVS